MILIKLFFLSVVFSTALVMAALGEKKLFRHLNIRQDAENKINLRWGHEGRGLISGPLIISPNLCKEFGLVCLLTWVRVLGKIISLSENSSSFPNRKGTLAKEVIQSSAVWSKKHEPSLKASMFHVT